MSRYGLIAFASSLDQIGPLAATVEDAALLLEAIWGHDPCDSTSIAQPLADLRATLDDGVDGLRVGIVEELTDVDGIATDVRDAVEAAGRALEKEGATVERVSLPSSEYGLSAYYLIAPAEASSNLARYDGVRYGLRVDAPDVATMNASTRDAGFGPEVKRRIMLGTYALSAGYYDAYYGQAQRVRTLIVRDFARVRALRRAALADVADGRVRARRPHRRSARDVPERRVHDPVEPVGPPGGQRAVGCERRASADRRAGARAGARRSADVPRRPGDRGAGRRRGHAGGRSRMNTEAAAP